MFIGLESDTSDKSNGLMLADFFDFHHRNEILLNDVDLISLLGKTRTDRNVTNLTTSKIIFTIFGRFDDMK